MPTETVAQSASKSGIKARPRSGRNKDLQALLSKMAAGEISQEDGWKQYEAILKESQYPDTRVGRILRLLFPSLR